jgi:hypothetical protein
MMQTISWPDPHFVVLPHNPANDYPEDQYSGVPVQMCYLKRLQWKDTKVKDYGIYFRVMGGGFLVAMQ